MNPKTKSRLIQVRQALRKERIPQAVSLLSKLLTDADHLARRYAAEELGKLGEAAVDVIPALKRMFQDSDPSVRKSATRALGGVGVGKGVEEAKLALIEALQHEDSGVRSEATWALLAIGKEAKTAIPALLQALQDHVFWVKVSAIQVIGKMVESEEDAQEEAITALKNALQDEDNEVRKEAQKALTTIQKNL